MYTIKDIEWYLNDLERKNLITIGFANEFDSYKIHKHLVVGYFIVKDKNYNYKSIPFYSSDNEFHCLFDDNVRLNKMGIDTDTLKREDIINIIPATTSRIDVYADVPVFDTPIENILEKGIYKFDSVFIGFEIPNQPIPDWKQEYKKAFIEAIEHNFER